MAYQRHKSNGYKLDRMDAVAFKNQMQSLKQDLNVCISDKVNTLVEQMQASAVCNSCTQHSPTHNNNNNNNNHINNNNYVEQEENEEDKGHHHHKHREFDHDIKGNKYCSKQFQPRESLLTVMFERGEGRLVYNYAVAALWLAMFYTLHLEYLERGRISLNLDLTFWCFRHLPEVIIIWTSMFFSTVLIFVIYSNWANRPSAPGKYEKLALLAGLVGWFSLHLLWPCKLVLDWDITPICVYIISCEQMRLYMKVHSFLKENWQRTIQWKSDSLRAAHPNGACPSFDKFMYFMFAPTLIYRDDYPRTTRCNWWAVARHLANGLATITVCNYIMADVILPQFKVIALALLHDFGPNDAGLAPAIRAMYFCMLPGFAILLALFWGLVHSWANMWSEILTYADRNFYRDWWNCKRMSSYYRDWNLVIHEWLYEYIFKEIAQRSPPKKSKIYGAIGVFMLSSIFHEYSFIIGFRVFVPVMLILYSTGGPGYYFLSRSFRMDAGWNIALFANLTLGQGMFLAMYTREHYARINCQPVHEGIWNYLIPLSFNCEQLKVQ